MLISIEKHKKTFLSNCVIQMHKSTVYEGCSISLPPKVDVDVLYNCNLPRVQMYSVDEYTASVTDN